MSVSRKQIKKAIHRLRVDGKTPNEVIEFIMNKLCENVSKNESQKFQEEYQRAIKVDTSKLSGLMNGVTFNTGNGLLTKRTYNVLCHNFKTLTKTEFPLSYEDTNEMIKVLRDRNRLQALKLVKINSGLGLRESKDIIDKIFPYV